MVDTVYKEVTQNGVECPKTDSKCATRGNYIIIVQIVLECLENVLTVDIDS